jgi:tRNA A37 threonylcarbamoyltransferase TsaD
VSLENLAKKHSLVFSAPPIKLCTDNGVMVAWAGLEKFEKEQTALVFHSYTYHLSACLISIFLQAFRNLLHRQAPLLFLLP